MHAEFRGVRIDVVQGDITRADTEAIVNAANDHLWMGGGVAGAIKRAGGEAIEADAMRQGPVPVGEAVVTGAGALAARYVIHAAVMGQDLITSASAIAHATRSSLERAGERGIRSVAFPAFGTGVGGFPASESAAAMIEAALDFIAAADEPKIERIVFVLFSDALRAAFETALDAAVSGRR